MPVLTALSVVILGITLTRSVPAYTALGAIGFLVGAWSYNALS
jgi:hypothetical protein